MITSRGGKRIYFCPDCKSTEIQKGQNIFGVIIICSHCNMWHSWRSRLSKSTKETKE